MGLEYLKVTPEIMEKISAYDQEQQGRIMLAMIAYALDGVEPEFDGVEKFIWATLKMDIDRCAASIEKQSTNGSKGGRPPKSKHDNSETQKNPEKPTETQPKPSESLNSNTNTNINTNTNNVVVCARATAADEPVTGIDGEDLSADIRNNAEVDVLLKKYRMPEAVRGDLLDDIAEHGLDKVKRVMQEAARSDTRGGLSLNYYRACLKNDGKQRAAPSGKGSGDQMLRYTPEERKKNYSAAVLDFDEGD